MLGAHLDRGNAELGRPWQSLFTLIVLALRSDKLVEDLLGEYASSYALVSALAKSSAPLCPWTSKRVGRRSCKFP